MSNLLKDNKELMKEFDFSKNKNVDINNLTNHSGKSVFWVCKNCNGSWEAPVARRTDGSQCPYCSNRKVLSGFNDLETKFPDLAKEWNKKKNKDLNPNEVVSGSNKIVWWKCLKCGYEWQASISSRTIIGNGCRNCAINTVGGKITTKKINKYGNLTQSNPEISKEWNYEKNGDLKPEQFHLGSTQKVWWKCPRGHEYQQIIYSRAKDNINCPICATESHSSFPEQVIYFYCKKYFKKSNVYNRYKIDNYEADIFIKNINIAIEYDGYYYHNNEKTKKIEKNKNSYFKNNGIKLIRVKENAPKDIYRDNSCDIISIKKEPKYKDIDNMVYKLLNRIKKITSVDFNESINVQKDRIKIMDSYISNIKANSLADKNPEIAKEWNYEKNEGLLPEMFSYSSSKKVWWRCSKGHEWEDSINNRTHGNGCLVCSNRYVMPGVNDLASKYPDIAKIWNYKKNGELKPHNIIYGSMKSVWWKCSKGHEWEEKIHNIISIRNDEKCPYCGNRKLLKGFNDLATAYPKISKDWNYTKNDITPDKIIFNNNGKYWWKCSVCGYEWEAYLYNRVNRHVGCPKCGIEKQLKSFNANQVAKKGSLRDNNKKLALEWNYEKNGELTPDDIIATSNKKVWWKCSKGHEWEASIYKRNNGTGCPTCFRLNKKKGMKENDNR